MSYLLGIDIGTTNVKAVLFDKKGAEIGVADQAYPTSHPHPGWAHQQPEDWYQGVVGAIKRLLDRTGILPEEIMCAGFSGHIRTIAFLDEKFEAVYPGIVWSDTRSAEIAQKLNEEMEDFLVKITGNRAATNYSLPPILWMRENHPEIFKKTKYFCTPKDYVLWKLTGNFVSDPSNQSGSLLLDIDSKQFSLPLLERMGLKIDSLPRLKRSVDIAGYVTSQAALETGLKERLPIIIGGGDNDCAAIGAGAYAPGVVSVSLGTAGIVLTLLERPDRRVAQSLDMFAHVIPEGWYTMGMVKAAGFAMGWLKDRLAGEGYEVFPQGKAPSMGEWIQAMEQGMGEFSPGSDGLFCFPYYQGRGNPRKDPQAKGVFWGLTSSHTNRHLMQASMEGVGYCIKECIQAIEEFSSVEEIVCCGGGSSSKLWMQIIADILEKPVWTGGGAEKGALGAAILASVGAGLYSSVQQACKVMTRHDSRYLPRRKYCQAYEELFQQFCALSDLFWK